MITAIVKSVKKETPTVSTLYFNWEANIVPGQFIMVWVPGVGEIPMSLSHIGKIKAVTVKNYGVVSDAILGLGPGNRIYFRGPYGNGFSKPGKFNLLIGGGSGMASLCPLISENSFGLVSAKTSDELLFTDRFNKDRVLRVTDDGSSGLSGYPVDHLRKLKLDDFEKIYVCGPEIMLKTVFDYIREKRPDTEISLERTMKCGIGVCDSCSIDGRQLCIEGPVFRAEEIDPDGEFGHEKLTFSGKRNSFR